MRPPWEHSVRMSGDQDVNYTSGGKKRGGGDNSISKLIQENNDILGKGGQSQQKENGEVALLCLECSS